MCWLSGEGLRACVRVRVECFFLEEEAEVTAAVLLTA